MLMNLKSKNSTRNYYGDHLWILVYVFEEVIGFQFLFTNSVSTNDQYIIQF